MFARMLLLMPGGIFGTLVNGFQDHDVYMWAGMVYGIIMAQVHKWIWEDAA